MFKEFNRIRPLFSRRDKWYYVGLLAMILFGSLVTVVGVGSIPAFVAILAMPERVFAHPTAGPILAYLGIQTSVQLVMWGCIAIIALFLFKNGYLVLLHYAQVRITEIHRVRLSDRLFTAYMNAPYEFHLNRNSAELLRNVQTETREIVTGIVNPLVNTVKGTLVSVGIVLLLAFILPPVVFIAIGLVSLASFGFIRVFRKRLRNYGMEAKHERKESIRAVNQGLGGIIDAIVLDRTPFFTRAFHRSVSHFATVDRLRQVIGHSGPLILESVAVLGLLVVVFSLIAMGTETADILPIIAAFGAAVVRLKATIGSIVKAISQMNYSSAAVPIVVDDLRDLESGRRAKLRAVSSSRGADVRVQHTGPYAVELRNITYTYPGAPEPALSGVSLSVPRGSSVGLVGPTGSGKSTLVNVILGLLVPQEGMATVEGIDVRTDPREWRKRVGYIPQTIFLLDESIRRNVAFGIDDVDIDDEAVWRALDAAQIGDFVRTLELGVHTVVGERGVRLSGGQRQRIGLARALYNDPEILIMDEATSSLDNQTENLVMQALDELREGRSFVIIAHRLTTVRKCDTLYFLRDGRIDSAGTYDELVCEHADFKRMAEVA